MLATHTLSRLARTTFVVAALFAATATAQTDIGGPVLVDCPSIAPGTGTTPTGSPYIACGELIQTIECLTFFSDAGDFYIFDDYGGFGVGDRVQVIGCLQSPCPNFCGVIGCVTVQSIGPCPHDSPFSACGTLMQTIECLAFFSDAGVEYAIDDTGGFVDGDRVYVTGTLTEPCITFCGVSRCLSVDQITDCPVNRPFCFGNGGDQMGCTDCPCDNNAPLLAPFAPGGCLNGVDQSAALRGFGLASVIADTLRMEMSGGNPFTFGVLAAGNNQLPAISVNCPPGSGIATPFFDGLRCIGGGVFRFGARGTDANGNIGVTNPGWGGNDNPSDGLVSFGGFSAGQLKQFQVFYREQADLVCMTGQNTSNGVEVMVVP